VMMLVEPRLGETAAPSLEYPRKRFLAGSAFAAFDPDQ